MRTLFEIALYLLGAASVAPLVKTNFGDRCRNVTVYTFSLLWPILAIIGLILEAWAWLGDYA